jgi:hypothetical protein
MTLRTVLNNARDDGEQDDVDRARKNFLKELEAYNQLIKLQGEIVPRCYGKYIYRIISQDAKETRDVHVLLLEYFNGITLFDFALPVILHSPLRQNKRLLLNSSIWSI